MRHPVEEGHDEVDPRPKHRFQPSEPFDDEFLALRHDANAKVDAKQDEACQQEYHNVAAKQPIQNGFEIHDAILVFHLCDYAMGP